MAGRDTHLISDRTYARTSADPMRRGIILFLVLASIAISVAFFTQGVDWKLKNHEHRQLGDTASYYGKYTVAQAHYEKALSHNPYDWQTHLLLAEILYHKLNQPGTALPHYLYALAYSPEPAIVEEVRNKVHLLRLLRSGELENPQNAIEDLILAAEMGAEDAFRYRLAPPLRSEQEMYWQAWRQRGRGKITDIRLSNIRDGYYDAAIELKFPDDSAMLLHLRCSFHDIWRMDLSFP